MIILKGVSSKMIIWQSKKWKQVILNADPGQGWESAFEINSLASYKERLILENGRCQAIFVKRYFNY